MARAAWDDFVALVTGRHWLECRILWLRWKANSCPFDFAEGMERERTRSKGWTPQLVAGASVGLVDNVLQCAHV